MSNARTYIFAGGGTGGHLFPGIAVAQELMRREPDARVLFVGSERDLEASILARQGFDHRSLPVQSLGSVMRRPIRFVRCNWQAWRAAKSLLRDRRPAAVIGLGGYASAPVVWAASRAGIPVVLLEQNVVPGRTTRWLSRSARVVCLSFSEAAGRLPRGTHVEVTGNPLRGEIAELHSARTGSRTAPRELLILGGSQGADSLNDAAIAALRQLRDELAGWRIAHQTGPRQVAGVRSQYAELSLAATVEPFFDDMAERYQSASVVISRAGATTLSELTCCGLPMILLPYAHAADDHQRANARSLADRGAAFVVEHLATAEKTGEQLLPVVRQLLNEDTRRDAMSNAARNCARPDATSRVVDIIQSLSTE
jgi:UDP-N-acetylglucosamine--N-acetylmuramyl-(pentapeptide) pyrophosphoryl-undecaprenol N-acetylglucosamine transferase